MATENNLKQPTTVYDFCKDGVYAYDFNETDLPVKTLVIMKCLDCCCYDATNVHDNDCTHCPLCSLKKKWVPKSITKPRIMSDEQKAKAVEALKKYREKNLHN